MEQAAGRSNSGQAHGNSVEVELDNSGTPFLNSNSSKLRDDDPEVDVEASRGHRRVFRDRRTLYFCIGVLTASVVAVCVFVGMHFRLDKSVAEEEECLNSTVASPVVNAHEAHASFACSAIPECPKQCAGDMCMYITARERAGESMCTCQKTCEPNHKPLNISGKFVCLPQCCSSEESFGRPCCPSELANVTSDTGELLCCPPNLLKVTRNVIPPFLQTEGEDSGQTVDLCFTDPPEGRTLGKEHVSFPTKPLTCAWA